MEILTHFPRGLFLIKPGCFDIGERGVNAEHDGVDLYSRFFLGV